MKGTLKAIKRAPHLVTSKVGMSAKSSDAETEDLRRRFKAIEEETQKLLKDAKIYRDGVSNMISASANFSTTFTTLFSPIGTEHDLASRYPSAQQTIQLIATYQDVVADLRDTIQPELDLIDSRIVAPVKEFTEVLKTVSKTITKRDHKLVDFDRHNNSYTKLREKKEKSLKDEQNLFKLEQDYEAAMQEYENYNGLVKSELPRFFKLTTSFISPLFHSFYYMQLNILFITLEKVKGFAGEKFDLSADLESLYLQKLGDTAQQIENLAITKRFVSTAKLMSDRRQSSNDGHALGGSTLSSRPSLATKPSSSKLSSGGLSPMPTTSAAPPPYSPAASGVVGKRPAPPPPVKPRPAVAAPPVEYVTALYDFTAQADGDLSFCAGDRIEVIKKTGSTEDWWEGRLNGQQGVFPGNYVQ